MRSQSCNGILLHAINDRILSYGHPGLSVDTDMGRVRLTPDQARDAVSGVDGDTKLREPVWRQVIIAAQQAPLEDESERLFAVWLAEPWMCKALRLITTRLRVDYEDVEAEMVTSFLEGLTTADAGLQGAGERLLKFAANRAWSAARRPIGETPSEDPSRLVAPDDRDLFSRVRWEVEISPPPREQGLSAPLRLTGSRAQIEGERLGMLAHEFGLSDVVYRARRPSEGRPIGTLSLPPLGAGR